MVFDKKLVLSALSVNACYTLMFATKASHIIPKTWRARGGYPCNGAISEGKIWFVKSKNPLRTCIYIIFVTKLLDKSPAF